MANVKAPSTPVALNDFYKSNGEVHRPVMPGGPSLTRQEFSAECDINTIMSRYDGFLSDPMRSVRIPQYVDFTEFPETLMGFMDVLKAGETAFYSLPATVRREFDNDPASFVDFASDPTNVEQMRAWGLAAPAPEKPQGPPSAAPGASSSAGPVPASPGPVSGATTHGST